MAPPSGCSGDGRTMPESASAERMRALRDAVARKKAEVQALEHRRDAARQELRRLEAELGTFDLPHPVPVGEPPGSGDSAPTTGAGKVALFRSLFRGRDDVFPVRWTSKQDRTHGLCARVRQRMDAGSLRKTPRPLWGVSESGVPAGSRPRDPGPPSGTPCRWRLSTACRRNVLAPRGGLRQGGLEGGCRRIPWRLRRRSIAGRDRAVAVGRRGPCLVLLRCPGTRSGGSPNGLLPDDPSDVEPPRSRHEFLRSVVPESGHDASRGLRQPDRLAAATRPAGQGQHRIRRRRLSPFSRSMGVPCRLATHSGVRRRADRGRRAARRPDARGPHERNGGGRLGDAVASSTITPATADDAGR